MKKLKVTNAGIKDQKKTAKARNMAATDSKKEAGDVALFSLGRFLPAMTPCSVCRVYDGDSAHGVVEFPPGQLSRFKLRLAGIDTQELRGTRGRRKRLALQARDRLRELADGQVCFATFHGEDKYGRVLTTLVAPDGVTNLNQLLLDEGLAAPYAGGTKIAW